MIARTVSLHLYPALEAEEQARAVAACRAVWRTT